MVKVRYFGTARTKFGTPSDEFEVGSVNELAEALNNKYPKYAVKDLRNFLYYVNGEPIASLKMFKTPLKDGDEVAMLSPVSGG